MLSPVYHFQVLIQLLLHFFVRQISCFCFPDLVILGFEVVSQISFEAVIIRNTFDFVIPLEITQLVVGQVYLLQDVVA